MIRLLVKTRINLNAKNLKDKTALDMAAANVDIERILLSAGAKSCQQITSAPTLVHTLRSSTTIFQKMLTWISRIRRDITEEQRNTWLLVATIVATSTYQSIVSPPGGVYQANASDNNVNITSSNSTITNTNPGNVGKSVLSKEDFFSFSFSNMLSFFVSIIAILFLSIPSRPFEGLLVLIPVVFFVSCYLDSLNRISPTRINSIVVDITVYSILLFVMLIFLAISGYSILQLRRSAKKFSKPLDATQTTVGQIH